MLNLKRIGTKIIIIVIAIIIMVMLAVTTRVAISEKRVFTNELMNKGESLAKFMAKVAPVSIMTYDVAMLESYVKEMTTDKEVLYAAILNKDGILLSAYLDKEKGITAGLRMGKGSETKELLKEVSSAKDVIEIEQPIAHQNERMGTIKIGLTKHLLKKKIREQILAMVIVSLIGISLAIGAIATYVTKGVVRPLDRDVSFAQAIALGDMTQRLDIKTDDELGNLGKTLNKMVEDLKGVIVKIKDSSTSITTISAQLSATSKRLFEGANIQMESVEVTSSSMTEMNYSIKSLDESVDVLSQLYNEVSSSILEMVTSISQVADSTKSLSSLVETSSSSVEEMSASIKQIAENAVVLSTAAEKTSLTIKGLTDSIKEIEESADKSAALSESVKRDASELGTKASEKAIVGMERMMGSVENASQIINRLEEKSKQIEQILTVITEVTDQTTLLSLNAAIIAAQAGEHGKGFAVVADEIKKLADRTAASTKKIAQTITSIQGEVQEAVTSMKEASMIAIEGMGLSKEVRGAFNKVLDGSTMSSQMTLEIKKAAKEQTKAAHQVNELVQTTTQMVREIAMSTQEQKKGSEQMMDVVETMRDVARQVQQATVEQTKGSRQISNAVETVKDRVESITRTTKEQQTGSNQTACAVEKIKDIARQNLDLSLAVNDVINNLGSQANFLKEEVKKFIIEADDKT
ncbi:MAG: HAMP domain-containing protein [Nitrospirae bacterium]|nr:HAMP domain-containing protein [Nitrospirota bacterium]MBI3378222.1 HAMP domain-containing protein [Nitrospirota bacterium]